MFKGSITALVTPFKDTEIDWDAFHDLIEWQIEQGTHGLVLCGTTGEAPTLSDVEHKSIVERGIAAVKSRIPVIIGTGSNATAKTVEATKHAKQAGADGALVVTPYYNRPTQEGLYAHYYKVSQSASLPIVIYNIPGRSAVDMLPETMARLAHVPNIVGVKDATGDLTRPKKLRSLIDFDFCQLSGEDDAIYDFLSQGGDGCISVTSNVMPAECARLHNSWMRGEKQKARLINQRLMPLHQALFFESSPAPAKYALARLGFCTDELRLPLIPASAACRKNMDTVMSDIGLISDQGTPILRAYG